jgi:hypothetical protein
MAKPCLSQKTCSHFSAQEMRERDPLLRSYNSRLPGKLRRFKYSTIRSAAVKASNSCTLSLSQKYAAGLLLIAQRRRCSPSLSYFSWYFELKWLDMIGPQHREWLQRTNSSSCYMLSPSLVELASCSLPYRPILNSYYSYWSYFELRYGKCRVFKCHSDRGPTDCLSGECMCCLALRKTPRQSSSQHLVGFKVGKLHRMSCKLAFLKFRWSGQFGHCATRGTCVKEAEYDKAEHLCQHNTFTSCKMWNCPSSLGETKCDGFFGGFGTYNCLCKDFGKKCFSNCCL